MTHDSCIKFLNEDLQAFEDNYGDFNFDIVELEAQYLSGVIDSAHSVLNDTAELDKILRKFSRNRSYIYYKMLQQINQGPRWVSLGREIL